MTDSVKSDSGKTDSGKTDSGKTDSGKTDSGKTDVVKFDESDLPRWRGVHHLALTTNDMDATTRFYHGVLGMRIVATIATPDFRHYFFEIGPGNAVAFFEWRNHDVGRIEKPAGIPPDFKTQFDHLSFHLQDEKALNDLRARLEQFGCGVTEVVDHQIMKSVYFTDPNGISLEASYWVADATARPADYADSTVMFLDTDPVPALAELRSAGDLAWAPTTKLLGDDDTTDPS